ncbi:unnamed protein product [Bursaphelenchus xylophilus]|nr:unnamed protein product [Bursaphelenchus xylophilus]CAG9101017.1 unnamed protein product [Bursaphelenchus xylophilus]
MTTGRRKSTGPRVNVNVHHGENIFVIYTALPIKYEELENSIRHACGFRQKEEIALRIVDSDGDPVTIENQHDLNEVMFFTKTPDVVVHVGQVGTNSDTSSGDNVPVHRRGARRQNKVYTICGHRFEVKRPEKRMDCEICGDVIWGLGRGGLKCMDCTAYVHKKCHKYLCKPCDGMNKDILKMKHDWDLNFDRLQIERLEPTKQRNPLDDYDLLKVLGRGSYAKVFQAQHRRTKEIVALKTINKTMFLEEDEDLDWLQTEKSVFETASNHPFLVGLHSCFQTESHLFFVIEFVSGGDLMFHMQQQRRLSEDHTRFYSAEIILALHFLHSRNIIYRDLKLDNVLLDHQGHVKLTDFGMCKEKVSPTELTKTKCGTPNYMAPEIHLGMGYNFAVDYWSLGIMIFEMLAGRSPFQLQGYDDPEAEEEELERRVLNEQIRMPRSFSVRACLLLKGFLNKDPKQRLGSRSEVNEGLQDIKRAKFYKDLVDWSALEKRKIKPPFRPEINGDFDYSRFDENFTKEKPTLTPVSSKRLNLIDQTEFEGFEYINPLQLSREDVV